MTRHSFARPVAVERGRGPMRLFLLSLLPFLAITLAAPPAAWGEEQTRTLQAKTLQERHVDRANQLREQSKSRAQSSLTRPNVGPVDGETFERDMDYYALGSQIRRLGAMLQRLADPARGSGLPGLGAQPAPGDATLAEIYGPLGPTEKTVRVLLDYRLMVAGNPRLKVGRVEDNGADVTARIVTADGSIVEEYSVDKKSGVISPVR